MSDTMIDATNAPGASAAVGPAKGPKMLNQVGKDADDSRMLVDIMCKRVVRPGFDGGSIPGRVDGPDALRTALGEDIAGRLIRESEWFEMCQRVNSWQDRLETCAGAYDGSSLSKILQTVSRFPTLDRARALLGEEMTTMYREALEHIEANRDLYSEFPDEKSNGGWSKQAAERAVALVIDVIAPHGSDPDGMSTAYGRYMEEYRSQTRERKVTHNVDREEKKRAARDLGIWLPISSDLEKWEKDPRTIDRAAEFQRLSMRVVDKMRIMRSVLQFIPRRRFSTHTISDLDANIQRMRAYMRDSENRDEAKRRSPATPNAKRSRDGDDDSEEDEDTVEKTSSPASFQGAKFTRKK
jgi:hypothetical protein